MRHDGQVSQASASVCPFVFFLLKVSTCVSTWVSTFDGFCIYSVPCTASCSSLPSSFPQSFLLSLAAAFISSLVSFVPPNASFSIPPLIATQQNTSAASPTSESSFPRFVDANFASLLSSPFIESRVQSFAFDASSFLPPCISVVDLFVFKGMHKGAATRCLNRRRHMNVCHHIKAGKCSCSRKHKDCVPDGGCSLQGVTQTLGFLMEHKGRSSL